MNVTRKKGYYDVIAGLSAFECSQEVTFSREDLLELVKAEEEVAKQNGKPEEDVRRKRTTVHGYLGGKVDLNEASNAIYDLSHTLLGGYVPKRQLESLSSVDFAHYFHKTLECEDALQIYEVFVGNGYGQIAAQLNSRMINTGDTSPGTPASGSDNNGTETVPAKVVRRVIVCRRCKSRFVGPRRKQELEKHECRLTRG
ncbi:hypothetical protein HG537_0C04500 [Torulaspora globosa]|uniref:Uncharacterized protein n=1 Tax=Torulaspora globosa TaxID=48254 RepID=A0A7H9HRA0_9SACH|nr:hypothetical protein HG537_0C04500 [Torulaspora sp. CBS 2947]